MTQKREELFQMMKDLKVINQKISSSQFFSPAKGEKQLSLFPLQDEPKRADFQESIDVWYSAQTEGFEGGVGGRLGVGNKGVC